MLDAVLGGERLGTFDRRRCTGAEWDAMRDVPLKVRRRLTSAGWLRRDGLAPDWLAQLLEAHGPPCPGGSWWDTSTAVTWYLDHAGRAVAERRAAHHHDRHHAVALASGHGSYFARRDALARAAGYRSLWDMRKALGWTGTDGSGPVDWRSWRDYLASCRPRE